MLNEERFENKLDLEKQLKDIATPTLLEEARFWRGENYAREKHGEPKIPAPKKEIEDWDAIASKYICHNETSISDVIDKVDKNEIYLEQIEDAIRSLSFTRKEYAEQLKDLLDFLAVRGSAEVSLQDYKEYLLKKGE